MAGPECLVALALESHDGREELLRGDQSVEGLGILEAGVAVAARLRVLPEVAEEILATALDRLAQSEHRVEVLPEAHLEGAIAGALVDHATLLHHIAQAVGHPRDRRLAVATRTAGLLVIALDGLRQIDVRDEAHVGLVDAHAERDGRDHHHAVFTQEPRLVLRSHLGGETRVVRQCVEALRREIGGRLLDRLATERVDDADRPLGLRTDERDQLLAGIDLGHDAVLDVRAVEAGDEMLGAVEPQPLGELLVRRAGGGRRERHAGDPREPLAQIAQREIVGTEVVAPLRHAMRLVDRDDTECAALQQRRRLRRRQPLGCDVDEVELTGDVRALDLAAFLDPLGGVEVRGVDAVRPECVDLVVHQCDQRADHETRAFAHERGHLVGDALSPTGRHEDDGISAADDVLDDRGLVAAELVVAEHRVQRLASSGVAPGGGVPHRRRARPGRGRPWLHRRHRALTPVERRLVARPLRLPVHGLGRLGGLPPRAVPRLVGVGQILVRITGGLRHPSSVTTPADVGRACGDSTGVGWWQDARRSSDDRHHRHPQRRRVPL